MKMIIDMNEKIEKVKKTAEAKRKFVPVPETPFITINDKTYTAEELYEQYLANESFRGKLTDFENIKKYAEMVSIAKELEAMCEDIERVILLAPEVKAMWANIHIDFLWMMSLKKEQTNLLIKLLELSDSFSINGSSFSTVRLNFGINNVWKE
ncbi:MAG: hypothetical protein WCN92_09635 [Eubacteriales bacterium]